MRRRQPRVHGRQIGPFQGAARRVRIHQEHAVAGPGEHMRQPDRGGGLARARLQVGQGKAKTRHPGIMPAPRHCGQAGAACWRAIRVPELRATGAGRTSPGLNSAAAPPSRPVSGTVGVSRWTGRPPSSREAPPSAQSPAGPHRCSGQRGGDLGLPGCLFAPGRPASGRRWPACLARPHPFRWPGRHRHAETVQYCSIHGITAVSWRGSCHHHTANRRFPHGVAEKIMHSAQPLAKVTHSLWTAVEINYNCATGLTALTASPCWHPHWRAREARRVPAPVPRALDARQPIVAEPTRPDMACGMTQVGCGLHQRFVAAPAAVLGQFSATWP